MWSRAIQRGLRGNTGIGENGLHKNETYIVEKKIAKANNVMLVYPRRVRCRKTDRQTK